MYNPTKPHNRVAQNILHYLASQNGPQWRKYDDMRYKLNTQYWFNYDRYIAILKTQKGS